MVGEGSRTGDALPNRCLTIPLLRPTGTNLLHKPHAQIASPGVARPGTGLQAGDHVHVIAKPEDRAFIQLMFGRPEEE